ncbi:MAG: energy transducer TonB [Candidatus Omnitrophota bacterium]
MTSEKFFQGALIISALAHISFIAVQLPSLDFLKNNKAKRDIKVVYIKNTAAAQFPKMNAMRQQLKNRIPAKITAENKNMLAPLQNRNNILKRNRQFAAGDPALIKPFTLKPDIIPVKKKISLPPVEMTKISNPSYINYYQLVREKIRRSAYQNYSRTETGEIFLSFVISQDGSLRDIRLVEDKSTPSYYLRDIAERSIRIAAPFPMFPKDLDYPQLSFNVIISFEIE